MKQNIIIRKRKSVKNGITCEYRFETASIISDILMVRQKSDITKKYTNLSKAIATLG